MSELDRLISGMDHDALVRVVDACCASRDWDELVRVRDKCSFANDAGRQMWPITTLANYRLALHAPPAYAVRGLAERNPAFLFGPLSEVIAQNHTWDELAPHLEDGPIADMIAHERAIRSEVVPPATSAPVFDIPRMLQTWEPRYAPALYSDSGVEHQPPDRPREFQTVHAAPTSHAVSDAAVTSALRALIEPWVSASNGRAEIVGAEGGTGEALNEIGVGSARLTKLAGAQVLELLAWAGASGGAHGRRRGLASGRYASWWAVSAIAGFDWPASPDDLGEALADINWWQWDAHEPETGWSLRIIAEDPTDNVSWVLNAVDTAS